MIFLLIVAMAFLLAIPCLIALVVYFRHVEHSVEAAEARKDARIAQERVDRLTEAVAAKGGYTLTLPSAVPDVVNLEHIPGWFSRKKRPQVQIVVPKENAQ